MNEDEMRRLSEFIEIPNRRCWMLGHKWLNEIQEHKTPFSLVRYMKCKRCGETEVV